VSKNKIAPILATARIEDVPYFDKHEVLAEFYGQRFVFDFTNQVHDEDFYFFPKMDDKIVFCDIGANIGQSVNTLRLFGSKAELHSFEINPICLPLLEKRGAEYAGKFTLHPYGLGYEKGHFNLFVPVNGPHAVSTLGALSLDSLRTQHLTDVLQSLIPGPDWRVIKMNVEVRVFDSLGIKPDFVKIDVEGAETIVLKGMTKTIQECRPVFLVENTAPVEVETYLAPFGYLPCYWDRVEAKVRVGQGKDDNSLYMHSTEIVRRSRQYANSVFRNVNGSAPALEQTNPMLEGAVTDNDIVEACRVFYGVSPTPEQVAIHRASHKSKLALRNHFINYLLQS
jgi:FkbM family methyltransferase